MKNLIGIAVIASTLFACNGVETSKTESTSNAELRTELMQAKHETEVLKLRHEMELMKAKQEVVNSEMMAAVEKNSASNAYLPAARSESARRTQQVDNEWTSSPEAYRSTPTVATRPVSEVKKKKGMSTAAKGALIGAGVGAVTGAVVSKKKVKGAVIGAVVGAGAGAGTGVLIDKRKQKQARTAGTAPYYAYTSLLN